ncbi:hypothetical protein [Aquimarina megaterium]|uniref:hypothetical protein n=1 Tax=Aquimarina megaterium TaxID=1443666 RepID=UPI000941CD6B|nr:hypothetical protein [Aquimarina megaterium]
MKNKIKFNLARIIVIFTLFLCYSCSSEEDTILETEESIETTVLTPKTLATISLPSGTTITFKTEVDGIVFEASGDSDNYSELDGLNDLSLLHRFLTLTDKSIAVPEDLIKLEEDQKIKEKALQRDIVEKHHMSIPANTSFITYSEKNWLDYCDSPTAMYVNNFANDAYREAWVNYPSTQTFSQNKPGALYTKCRTVKYRISNCSYKGKIEVSHYKGSTSNLYTLVSKNNIGPRKHKIYVKSFLAYKYYQKVDIKRIRSASYVGDVIFSNYTSLGIE